MVRTLDDYRVMKKRLEQDLETLVEEFSRVTGLTVSDLSVEYWPPQETVIQGVGVGISAPVTVRATVEL